MELEEFYNQLLALMQDHGLEDEGCTVMVNGVPVIAAEWDGNTTIELLLEA